MGDASKAPRNVAMDVAKAVAALAMIQTHAYGAWVAPNEKVTTAYAVTRVLGTLALPSFLVLSGMSFALRVLTAEERGESTVTVRRDLMIRGLRVVGWGYVVSLAYALLDGGLHLSTVLRGDVLHAIGFSLFIAAFIAVRGPGAPRHGALLRNTLLSGVAVLILCPWITRATVHANDLGALRYVLAPFVDVPGLSPMPVVPLFAWFAAGVPLAFVARRTDPAHRAIGATLLIGAALATTGMFLTAALLGQGFPFSRASFVIWPNYVDLLGRAILLLGFAAALAATLPPRAVALLRDLGRHSLLIYAVHIPFCYGRFGKPLQAHLTVAAATPWFLALAAACAALALAKERHGRRPRNA